MAATKVVASHSSDHQFNTMKAHARTTVIKGEKAAKWGTQGVLQPKPNYLSAEMLQRSQPGREGTILAIFLTGIGHLQYLPSIIKILPSVECPCGSRPLQTADLFSFLLFITGRHKNAADTTLLSYHLITAHSKRNYF